MNVKSIYYKEQCDYCINKGKCGYEKLTRTFLETLCSMEHLASGVFGSLTFKCDYFYLDELAYDKANPPETCG